MLSVYYVSYSDVVYCINKCNIKIKYLNIWPNKWIELNELPIHKFPAISLVNPKRIDISQWSAIQTLEWAKPKLSWGASKHKQSSGTTYRSLSLSLNTHFLEPFGLSTPPWHSIHSTKSHIKINLASKGLDFIKYHTCFFLVIWRGEHK